MKYLQEKNSITKQIRKLHQRGGHYQKAATKVYSIIGRIQNSEDPYHGISTTNHGETRIKHCVKYDLNGYCRLITIQNNGINALVFVGDHDECEQWLNRNRNYTLTLNDENQLTGLRVTENLIIQDDTINVDSKISEGPLILKLKGDYAKTIEKNINGLTYRKLLELDCFSDDDTIIEVIGGIENSKVKDLIFDVLLELKEDNLDKAKDRIMLFNENIRELSSASASEIERVIGGEEFVALEDFNTRDYKKIIEGNNWLDWMLFMHPNQKKIVDEDFKGTARLLGVSGSGKTCVVVNRAIRLAQKYQDKKILITTINRSLSDLIKDLIDKALDTEIDRESLKPLIEVKSFWQICKDLILESSKDESRNKLLEDVTFKTQENVEQIWREFYQCLANNSDAEVLLDVHSSLLSRNVFASQYIKQEFDYIRSALNKSERKEYITMDREGRSEPLTKKFRQNILEGLEKWEDKMEFVGVIDYLGILELMEKHVKEIHPKYRCILVDELQDFGTTELAILRKLVKMDENDLFLCGDIAQQVLTKQHRITQANIRPGKYLKITKNYRNSREILQAASNVFTSNIDENQYNDNGFELLNPEFANFSTPKPFIRESKNLSQEIKNAITYLNENLDDTKKACIAIAGLSYFQVKSFGTKLVMPVLDGEHDLTSGAIFLSDLEQTKGFEFDRVILLNCSEGSFPNPKLPQSENFREISKLYVSMTRAKTELIISFNTELSKVFIESFEYFNRDTEWSDYILESNTDEIKIPKIELNSETKNYDLLTGRQYLYRPDAVGTTLTAQKKLVNIINGKTSTGYNGVQDGWQNIKKFKESLYHIRKSGQMKNLLGRKVFDELYEKLRD